MALVDVTDHCCRFSYIFLKVLNIASVSWEPVSLSCGKHLQDCRDRLVPMMTVLTKSIYRD